MNSRNGRILLFIATTLVLSCKNDNLKEQRGFVVFVDPKYWYFVPAKHLGHDPLGQFKSENLESGTQFRPFFKGRDLLMQSLDTIPLENIPPDMDPELYRLKIVPVKIVYEIQSEEVLPSSIFTFKCWIRGEQTGFKFNTLKINIKKVEAM